ncbi:MAG: ABC transporter permease subunit, partial [Betaproteobacteria bacterium]
MLIYILKRIALMLPTLLGALTITFLVIQFVPGGPIDQILAEARDSGGGDTGGYRASRDTDEKQIAELKKLYGFDKPVHIRYFEMLANFARFDLGRSFMHNKDVWELIKEKLPVSISLGLWSFLLSYLISVPLGISKAMREGSRFDTLTTFAVLVGYAIPGFVLGILLIVLFAGGSFWDVFPLRGLTSDNWEELSFMGKVKDYFWHLTLPLICLSIHSFAVITMLTKNTFVEEIRKQYVLVARAKGLSQKGVLYRHIFRNALLPLVTHFPAAFIGAFFAGSVLIETLFSLDGMGLLGYEAIVRR